MTLKSPQFALHLALREEWLWDQGLREHGFGLIRFSEAEVGALPANTFVSLLYKYLSLLGLALLSLVQPQNSRRASWTKLWFI